MEKEKQYCATYVKDDKEFVLDTSFLLEQIGPNMEIKVFIGSKENHEKLFERLKETYPFLKDYEIRYMEVEK